MSQAQATALAEPATATKGIEMVSQRQRAWRTFKGNRTAVVGLGMILVIVAIALAAPLHLTLTTRSTRAPATG